MHNSLAEGLLSSEEGAAWLHTVVWKSPSEASRCSAQYLSSSYSSPLSFLCMACCSPPCSHAFPEAKLKPHLLGAKTTHLRSCLSQGVWLGPGIFTRKHLHGALVGKGPTPSKKGWEVQYKQMATSAFKLSFAAGFKLAWEVSQENKAAACLTGCQKWKKGARTLLGLWIVTNSPLTAWF